MIIFSILKLINKSSFARVSLYSLQKCLKWFEKVWKEHLVYWTVFVLEGNFCVLFRSFCGKKVYFYLLIFKLNGNRQVIWICTLCCVFNRDRRITRPNKRSLSPEQGSDKNWSSVFVCVCMCGSVYIPAWANDLELFAGEFVLLPSLTYGYKLDSAAGAVGRRGTNVSYQ